MASKVRLDPGHGLELRRLHGSGNRRQIIENSHKLDGFTIPCFQIAPSPFCTKLWVSGDVSDTDIVESRFPFSGSYGRTVWDRLRRLRVAAWVSTEQENKPQRQFISLWGTCTHFKSSNRSSTQKSFMRRLQASSSRTYSLDVLLLIRTTKKSLNSGTVSLLPEYIATCE